MGKFNLPFEGECVRLEQVNVESRVTSSRVVTHTPSRTYQKQSENENRDIIGLQIENDEEA
jgi:hypothetical protein